VQFTCNSTASQPEACVHTQILANSNSQVQTKNIQVTYKRYFSVPNFSSQSQASNFSSSQSWWIMRSRFLGGRVKLLWAPNPKNNVAANYVHTNGTQKTQLLVTVRFWCEVFSWLWVKAFGSKFMFFFHNARLSPVGSLWMALLDELLFLED
jgi:hypothetical protein